MGEKMKKRIKFLRILAFTVMAVTGAGFAEPAPPNTSHSTNLLIQISILCVCIIALIITEYFVRRNNKHYFKKELKTQKSG